MKIKKPSLTAAEYLHVVNALITHLQTAERTSPSLSTYETKGYKNVGPRVYVHGDAHLMVRAILDELGIEIVADEAPKGAVVHAKWPTICILAALAFVFGVLFWNIVK